MESPRLPPQNMKVMVHSHNCDTKYFDIIAGVFQENTLASYLFMNC